MLDCIKIFWCWTFTQHTSFYLTSYVTDINYITHQRFFISLYQPIHWYLTRILTFCRSSEHRFSPCLHPELSTMWYDHSIVTYKFQYSWRVWTLPVQGRDCDSYYTYLPVSICSHTLELKPSNVLNMSIISLNLTNLPGLSWSHSSAH